MTDGRQEVRRQGLGVSAGIAFGRAYLIGRDTLKAPVIFDGRNVYDPAVARRHGLTLYGVGRRHAPPADAIDAAWDEVVPALTA